MSDFELKDSIEDPLVNIENDIKDIETILFNTYNAINTLDEKKWRGKEKTKLDQELLPYLSNIKEIVPKTFRGKLDTIKNGIEKHKELDKKHEKIVENDLSITIIDEIL